MAELRDLIINENATITGNARINGDTTINGSLSVAGSVSLKSGLTVIGNIDVGGGLSVGSTSAFGGHINIGSHQIIGSNGGTWISARDKAIVKNISSGQKDGYSYNPVVSTKTANGEWSIGNLSGSESLYFSYTTDINYGNQNNTAKVWTIDTNGNYSGSANYASTAIRAVQADNAIVASRPSGFASSSTTATWGNTAGSCIISWNDSSGGSIDFRKDNPTYGKLSIKVDGRVYVNEGLNPVLPANLKNGYWGMCDPDGNESSWIRTTSYGLIPYTSGGSNSGHSSIGKSDWRFNYGYFNNMYSTNLYVSGYRLWIT